MKVRLKKEISFSIKGSMSGVKLDDNTDLSKVIQSLIPIDSLFVFGEYF